MIVCPICGNGNHHLADTCVSCGSFLQTRVENLDLFSTLGRLIESPRKTFHVIGVARHKNYATMLAMAAGWPLLFTVFWAASAGEYAPSFLHLLVAGIATGPFFGLLCTLLLAVALFLVGRCFRVRVGFRNSVAMAAYAATPMLFVLLFLLPVVFLSFGLYFFTKAPSPQVLRPFSFYAITALGGASYAWYFLLAVLSLRAIGGAAWWRAFAVAALSFGVLTGAIIAAVRWVT